MSYAAFLVVYIVPPLIVLMALLYRQRRAGRRLPERLAAFPAHGVLAAHVAVAVIYTTPWDNYLVATRVWWYDPALVSGVLIGWVPVEEYAFFVLQTLMTGSLLLWLFRRCGHDAADAEPVSVRGRGPLLLIGVAIWLVSLAALLAGWKPGTYLALILMWALPPILLQLSFGADILWRERRPVALAIAAATLYLAAVDTLAIGSGTWTIAPTQTTGIVLWRLPVEEFVFFLVTNMLVVFGVTLVLSRASRSRVPWRIGRLLERRSPSAKSRSLSNV